MGFAKRELSNAGQKSIVSRNQGPSDVCQSFSKLHRVVYGPRVRQEWARSEALQRRQPASPGLGKLRGLSFGDLKETSHNCLPREVGSLSQDPYRLGLESQEKEGGAYVLTANWRQSWSQIRTLLSSQLGSRHAAPLSERSSLHGCGPSSIYSSSFTNGLLCAGWRWGVLVQLSF